jgi:hypothetical protein
VAAAAEVLTLADQALMQLAAEQGDAARAGVMAEPVAGHADLAAAAGPEQIRWQVGPALAVSAHWHQRGPLRVRLSLGHANQPQCVRMY